MGASSHCFVGIGSEPPNSFTPYAENDEEAISSIIYEGWLSCFIANIPALSPNIVYWQWRWF